MTESDAVDGAHSAASGSRATYASTTVCLLTSRRRAGSCYLISSGGAVRTSHPATLTPPTIKSVTSVAYVLYDLARGHDEGDLL
jgi:hypothetical protein